MNEFVLYEIVQEGLLPSLKLQAFLSGLWVDWQVYLPLSSQSSSFLNVSRPVGFRFGLQQKSFVMMKSEFPVRFPLWRNWGPLWCCRKRPAVFVWIWWICFVAMIVFCRCQSALCFALMIGGAALYVKCTSMRFRKSFEKILVMFLYYTHQNTYMWNLKPYLWSIRLGGNVFHSVCRRFFFLFL